MKKFGQVVASVAVNVEVTELAARVDESKKFVLLFNQNVREAKVAVNDRKIFRGIFQKQSLDNFRQQRNYFVQRAKSFSVDDDLLREKNFEVLAALEFFQPPQSFFDVHGIYRRARPFFVARNFLSLHFFHRKQKTAEERLAKIKSLTLPKSGQKNFVQSPIAVKFHSHERRVEIQ